jgi:hypothetical protein
MATASRDLARLRQLSWALASDGNALFYGNADVHTQQRRLGLPLNGLMPSTKR